MVPPGEHDDGMQAGGLQEPGDPSLLQEESGKAPQEGKFKLKLKRSIRVSQVGGNGGS